MLAEDKLEMKESKTAMQSSVFLGLGSPMLAMEFDDYNENVTNFFASIPLPTAIIVMSPNWITGDAIRVTASEYPDQIYDVGQYEDMLAVLTYPCLGDTRLANSVSGLLEEADFEVELDSRRGIDSGVWVPLYVSYPEANVPIVQISLPHNKDPNDLMKIGKVLAPLRKQGVLILGTGNTIFDPSNTDMESREKNTESWAEELDVWFRENITEMNTNTLLEFRDAAPEIQKLSQNHLLPLFFVLGSLTQKDYVHEIFRGFYYGNRSMFSFSLSRNF